MGSEIALYIGGVVGAFTILGVMAGIAAKVTRIHDAATVHLPQRIDKVETELTDSRDEQRADHAAVRAELAEIRTEQKRGESAREQFRVELLELRQKGTTP